MKQQLSDTVINYHEATKHHPNHYAKSPGFLDWANEPNPFRRYEGSPLIRLPFLKSDPEGSYHALFYGGSEPRSFTLPNIAGFLELSMGLSAWKSFGGASWALRMNPSSGNLHPEEAYLVLPPVKENNSKGGVFHYNPFFHAIELRASFDDVFWSDIKGHFKAEGFLLGLSSIYWREAWKYGERAFRYCNLDIGHASACLRFSANLMGWKMTCLNGMSDYETGTVLGFHKTRWREYEAEYPGPMFFVHGDTETNLPKAIPLRIISAFESLTYAGEPNLLSKEHRQWPLIDEALSACQKPATKERTFFYKKLNGVSP
ncbi:MAG: SagB/ThcOx family dehydrogenase [Nitrospirae bacterium]|nr:SagB/ThcOx family dehydrogenase [Nitrospirota bacterium]